MPMLVIASDAHKSCTTDQSLTKTANVNILSQNYEFYCPKAFERNHDINTA